MQQTETFVVTKSSLLRMLNELEAAGNCQQSIYLTPDSIESRNPERNMKSTDSYEDMINYAILTSGNSETGLVIFMEETQAVVVAPPFPISVNLFAKNAETSNLRQLMDADLLVGVVLLRLGRYAVGILRGENLVATKTGSRYVKSRHRAGGSSQRRFERSRERLVRELFDKTCETTRNIFSHYEKSIDHILMGGERQTLRGFVQRCDYLG